MSDLISATTSIAGAAIAWMLYCLNRTQQRESWFKTYKEVHESFWSDPIMAEVRSWIACDEAYAEIKCIIQKRQAIDENKLPPSNLKTTDYVAIDKLDKFLNFVLRISTLNSAIDASYGQNIWKVLSVEYWLIAATRTERAEMSWYIKKFFPELLDPKLLQIKLNSQKSKKKLWSAFKSSN